MRLSQAQRTLVVETLMDSANYVLAGLVFGQLVTGEARPFLFSSGLFIYFLGWTVSVRMHREVRGA